MSEVITKEGSFMGDSVSRTKDDSLELVGLEHVLEVDDATESDTIRPVQSRTSDTVGHVVGEKISITEAAIRFGVSERTIQRRIRRGKLGIEKDDSGRVLVVCPTEPDNSSVKVGQVSDDSSDQVGQMTTSVGQDFMISDNEQLWKMVREQASKIEALTTRNGWLESQLHEREEDIQELKLLTDSQHKSGWWPRFCAWFLGKQ